MLHGLDLPTHVAKIARIFAISLIVPYLLISVINFAALYAHAHRNNPVASAPVKNGANIFFMLMVIYTSIRPARRKRNYF